MSSATRGWPLLSLADEMWVTFSISPGVIWCECVGHYQVLVPFGHITLAVGGLSALGLQTWLLWAVVSTGEQAKCVHSCMMIHVHMVKVQQCTVDLPLAGPCCLLEREFYLRRSLSRK